MYEDEDWKQSRFATSRTEDQNNTTRRFENYKRDVLLEDQTYLDNYQTWGHSATSTDALCFKPSVRTRKNLPPSRRVKVRKKGEEEEESSRASERWNAWRFRVKLGEIEKRRMLIKMRRRQDNTHPSETISTYKKKFHEPSCAACFPSRPPLLIPDAWPTFSRFKMPIERRVPKFNDSL